MAQNSLSKGAGAKQVGNILNVLITKDTTWVHVHSKVCHAIFGEEAVFES